MALILLLDDDDGFRASAAETLADLGHCVVDYARLPDAVAHLARTVVRLADVAAVADGEGAASAQCDADETVFTASAFAFADRSTSELPEPTLTQPDLALVDLRLGRDSGLDFLRRARALAPDLPCVVLTAFASSDNTIEAMKLGAFDHLTKPIGRGALAGVVARALAARCRDSDQPAADHAGKPPLNEARPPDKNLSGLVGATPAMRDIHKRIGLAAARDISVLVSGETGTGKEVVARLLHRHSARAKAPFIAVNCAAIPAELIESELFGHARGAFSGAHADRAGRLRDADGGTLLLDEIGDMPLAVQAKLLRVLQEREVVPVGGSRAVRIDVRVVAASHHDLPAAVRAGRFREDLYYRVAVFPIHLPPLRERLADLPALAAHLLADLAPGKTLTAAALAALAAHAWPGNVRELKNVLEHATLMAHGARIDAVELALPGTESVSHAEIACSESASEFRRTERLFRREPTLTQGVVGKGVPTSEPRPPLAPTNAAQGDADVRIPWDAPLADALKWLETRMIQRALAAADGNVSEAARRLGISRQQLYRRLETCPVAQHLPDTPADS